MDSSFGIQIWSAVPTPLTEKLKVDADSVVNLINDAVNSGITGVFVAGTCGEGPWLADREQHRLIRTAAGAANGRLKIAAQVSDNSVPRILDNISRAADAGADYAIIATPSNMMNPSPNRIAGLFIKAAEASPLPVGIYDHGSLRPVAIPEERLKEVYLQPKVALVKDSSGSPSRRAIALAARESKPSLQLFNGDEFRCLEYLQAGYDGLMFGGAAAVAPELKRIVALFGEGRIEEAGAIEAEMRRVLFGIYGGESIECWLTGLKYYMVRRGLFASTASFLEFPLTETCRRFIDEYVEHSGRGRDRSGGK